MDIQNDASGDCAVNDPPIAFSVKGAVSASPLSRSAVYRAMQRGDLRAKKLGKNTIILRDDLVAFLASLPDYATAA